MAVCVMGPANSGKSCLIKRYVQGFFMDNGRYDPTLGDTYTKKVEKKGESMTVSIRDTAGIYHFAAMRDADIQNGLIFIVTFAVDNMFHWQEVPDVVEHIRKLKPQSPVALVACKSDQGNSRAVTQKTTETYAVQNNMAYFECSAKNNKNVNEVFAWATQFLNPKKK